MPFCVFGHPDRHGGPGVELPILVYDDGIDSLWLNTTAFLTGLRLDGSLNFKGSQIVAPLVFPDQSSVNLWATGNTAMARAIQCTVQTDVGGRALGIFIPQNPITFDPVPKVVQAGPIGA